MSSLVFQNFFPFVFIPAVFFIIIAVEYSSTKRQRQALRVLSVPFNGRISKSLFNCNFKGIYQGIEFSLSYSPQRKSTPPQLKIGLKKQTQLRLRISLESMVSRLGEKIGIVHEVKTSDEEFDEDFLIFSNRPQQTAVYLNREGKKNVVRELFGLGFNSLVLDGKGIFTERSYTGKDYSIEDLSLQKVKEVLRLLLELTNGA